MKKVPVKKILHITPHFGGGVGKVVLNYLEKVKKNPEFLHKAISLDYANDKARAASKTIGFSLQDKMASNHRGVISAITDADIVLIHWWNHPFLFDLLVREKLPACRIIIWSHVSGLHSSPYVFTKKIIQYPDIYIFTTPISLKTKAIKNLSNKYKKKLRIVWSTGGVEGIKSMKARRHSGFNVGYIGTVDYARLHPNFLNICNKIKIPNVKFIVCGGPKNKKIKKEKEVEGLDIAKRINFTGPIQDITKYLPIFDVFGYPLAPSHFGTCDQSLQESMAAGVVPVVLANPMEKFMVKDGITGIVAKNKKDYILAIEKLYKNPALRNSLSKNARAYAIKNFSLDKMVKDWETIFKELLVLPKSPRKWKISKKNDEITATDVFLEALGDSGQDFARFCHAKSEYEKKKAAERIVKLNKSTVWQADTRGTVHHYNSFFPGDAYLSLWSKLMKNELLKN